MMKHYLLGLLLLGAPGLLPARFEAVTAEYKQRYREFIKANPASWVSLNALLQMGMMSPPQYAVEGPLYEALSPALKDTKAGRVYGEKLQKLKGLAVGAPAPAFTQKTPEGKDVSLQDYRGKYVLVEFWASWCGPCRQENPALVLLYNEYKGRNFEVLGVSLDREDGREKWLKAIDDDQLPWTQVSDLRGWDNQVARLYNVHSIPQNYLVGPDGRIVAVNLKGKKLSEALAGYAK